MKKGKLNGEWGGGGYSYVLSRVRYVHRASCMGKLNIGTAMNFS